jgi:hypothetical protein
VKEKRRASPAGESSRRRSRMVARLTADSREREVAALQARLDRGTLSGEDRVRLRFLLAPQGKAKVGAPPRLTRFHVWIAAHFLWRRETYPTEALKASY